MTEQRIIASSSTREDDAADASIRPKRLADYLGQQPVREQMEIYIQAAKARGEAMDHVLIFGPRVSARPRSVTSSPTSWASACA